MSLVIAAATLISTYAVYGYRLGDLEKAQAQIETTINKSDEAEIQIQISLAKMQKDIDYIKEEVTKRNN